VLAGKRLFGRPFERIPNTSRSVRPPADNPHGVTHEIV